ncbi:piggyBac transposable element-derived protein 4-like [Cotesia glomerata]|uniref:piggyBac transposable element-derived protein 4-like n=1 Tax=Cotesia glomerata TaxID=32391 RepID=UPI001D020738|nr:piggyBac transposable element-derived protein 4-like [Cotesia glomerata]
MRAFFGLLYYSGLLNLSHVDIHDLWKPNGLSPEYFRAVMRENRFRLLLRALRFDNSLTRIERKKTDKLAPIREIWDHFNKSCLKYYSSGVNVIIDEMIAAFRGRCSFKQYIPSKPDRYGLKIFGMVDTESFYTSNMELYVGKQLSEEYQVSNKPFDVVQRVCHSILNTGRNITMDNWFSSLPLVIDLLEKHKITVVATLRKNKPQIPPGFVTVKKRDPCSSLFAFYRNITMVSYISQSKKKKLYNFDFIYAQIECHRRRD